MGYVGYFVVGSIWYPMIVDLVSHDHKIVTLEWKDMTGFTRFTNVKRSALNRLEDLAKPGSGYNVPTGPLFEPRSSPKSSSRMARP